jgi:hypothetical protein
VVKAGTHLAGAITAAFLLAGVGCAAAAADTNADSAESENRNSSASDRGPKAAEHSTNAHRKADKAVDSSDTKKKPVNHDHGTGERPGDKAIDTVPLRPEAPVDVVPLPQAPPALDAPPPADLPPIVPATPVDPDTLDSVTGEGGHGEIEPPVLTVPVLVAPAPIPPVRILGASIAQRGATGGRTVDPPPQSPGEPAPQMLRAPADGPPLRDPIRTSFGVTAPGQPYPTGYNAYSSRPLAVAAKGALPGVAGLVLMTSGGICLGYRQAKTVQQLRNHGIDRFMN